MKLRVASARVVILLAVILTALAVPAAAWALTSPKTTVNVPAEGAEVYGRFKISGSASHRVGVAGVRLVVRNLDDGTYFNGKTWQGEFIRFDVPVHDAGAKKTRWSYSVSSRKLTPGNYRARAFAYSVEGNGDSFGGDLNEFTYGGRFNRALYDTEITVPAEGQIIPSGALSISGVARSTEGVKSVRVVVRNRDSKQYWNAETGEWQLSFVRVDAELDLTDGDTEATWTVNVPAEQVQPGTHYARAWVRTKADSGDPFGRGRVTFTVEPAGTTSTTVALTTTVEPTTKVAPTTTAAPSSTAAKVEPTTSSLIETTTSVAAKETTTTEEATTTTATTAKVTTVKPTTTAKVTTVKPTTTVKVTTEKPTTTAANKTAGRRPYAQGNVDWKLVASDDFNGSTLDDNMWENGWWRTKGSKYDRPVAKGETACYHTDQVSLKGGELRLTMRPTTAAEDASGVCQKRDGSKAKFVSGYATTRQRYTIKPGTYIETRMHMPGEGNVLYNWPAFWTTDIDRSFGSRWPHSGEFDVAEVLKGQPCASFHYAKSADGAHQKTSKRCSTVSANRWVVFGMKWNYDGTVEYFHDGKRVKEIDPLALAGSFAINYEHNIALQHGLRSSAYVGYKEPTASNPLTVKFDYVDVYKL